MKLAKAIGASVAGAVVVFALVVRIGSDRLASAVVDQALAPFVWLLGKLF